MPSVDREDSQDRELVRHSHSFSSDVSRLSIPMYVSFPLLSLTTQRTTREQITNAEILDTQVGQL